MTSPAIKADDKALKAARQPVSSNQQSNEATSMLPSSNTQFHTSGFVSWLKVFRFCDLLMRQGC